MAANETPTDDERARLLLTLNPTFVAEIRALEGQLSRELAATMTVESIMAVVETIPQATTRVAMVLRVLIALERNGWQITRLQTPLY